jgi:hypothetical protein
MACFVSANLAKNQVFNMIVSNNTEPSDIDFELGTALDDAHSTVVDGGARPPLEDRR